MVNRNSFLLGIQTNAHLTGTADQHADGAIVHLLRQLSLLLIVLRIMDKGNFLCRNTQLHKPALHIVIELCAFHINRCEFIRIRVRIGLCAALTLWRCHITEDHLRTPGFAALLVHSVNILAALIDFTSFLIRQARINHALGIGYLSAVAGDFQHVILSGINILHILSTLSKFSHVVLLEFALLTLNNLDLSALHLGNFQARNIGKHIGKASEQLLQGLNILELREGLL